MCFEVPNMWRVDLYESMEGLMGDVNLGELGEKGWFRGSMDVE